MKIALVLASAVLAALSFSSAQQAADLRRCMQTHNQFVPENPSSLISLFQGNFKGDPSDLKRVAAWARTAPSQLLAQTAQFSGDDRVFEDEPYLDVNYALALEHVWAQMTDAQAARMPFPYITSVARDKLAHYAKASWEEDRKTVAEWALDRFFEAAFDLGTNPSEGELLEVATKFDLRGIDKLGGLNKIAAARVAVGYSQMPSKITAYKPLRRFLRGQSPTKNFVDKFDLEHAISDLGKRASLTGGCGQKVADFFSSLASIDLEDLLSPSKTVIRAGLVALSMGAPQQQVATVRMLKAFQYYRILNDWQKDADVSSQKLAAIYQGTQCA